MRVKLAIVLLATAVAGCAYKPGPEPEAGVASVNVPVVSRSDFVFDASAPGGILPPSEMARLDGWFSGLGLGYGDSVHVDGAFAGAARAQVAEVAGRYGLLISPGSPVTAGAVGPDVARVVVSRAVASVPNCPNWGRPAQPNYNNRMVPGFGCAVNSNLAAMVANPQDLVHGREGAAASDGFAAVKAIDMYREWPLTGIREGQEKRPLKDASTKKDDQ